ncbi:hypothetical protein TIFTF001_038868 [Ficus carica]|uniref:Uncharacterized protein n=1 Tax=Ficus carica TaxID=3494 RepID=A0AA88E8U3_FICCA|nr:hypothetical protein TIFTF001_038868 [Ficus carica]
MSRVGECHVSYRHVSYHDRRGGGAALPTFKFQILNLRGGLAGSPIDTSIPALGFFARPSLINSGGVPHFSHCLRRNSISAEDCRGQPSEDTLKTSAEKFREGSSASTSSTSSSSAGESTGPRGRTPDHLSGISDIFSPSDPVSPTGREQGGAARLEEILRAGLSKSWAGLLKRNQFQLWTLQLREGTPPRGPPARPRPRSRAMRINDIKVYRRADMEMVDLADDRPVYTVDYYTSVVTRRYLDALRQEFRIPDNVDLVVPGADDLPSRPPPGYVALSAEYFRAGLRLSLHPFLRRALIRLNVALAQLNANAYRVLVGCFILWVAKFVEKLPFGAFQNIYRMKTAPSSKGFYYFQGFKRTFITGCPDSDKQFKHLWFYAGDRWLHGHLTYDEVPPSERVPVTFRRGCM